MTILIDPTKDKDALIDDLAHKAVDEAQVRIRRAPQFFNMRDLKEQFAAYSRQPFIEVLAELMQCVPEADKLQEFANTYPDRWANAIGTLSRLSGYHDKLEITGNLNIEIQNMGDAELLTAISEVNNRLSSIGALDGLQAPEEAVIIQDDQAGHDVHDDQAYQDDQDTKKRPL